MQIQEMLRKHLQKKSELAFRNLDLEEIEQLISYHNLVYIEALGECIEGEAMQAPALSAIPPSVTNKFNSKTENVMLNYNPVHENKIDIIQLKIDKANIERQIAPLRREVETVERLLISLSDKEKFVVDMRYIRSYNIEETISLFASQFRYGSRGTIENIEREALAKMEKIYNRKSA